MSNKKVQIKTFQEDNLFPRTTLDNIVVSTASSTTLIASGGKVINTYLPSASSSGAGTVQLATNAIASSGTNTTQAVTPAGMKNAMTWTKIQNMASSATVTINPGESYRLIATDGAVHTLNRATSAYVGYNGADAHVQIFLDTVSVINGNNISIMDKLMPSACNNCLVKYRDGEARLYLEDVYAGFTVTVNASDVSATGTVFDGIINWGSYITFTKMLDGEVIDMYPLYYIDGANYTGHDSIIVGNGPDSTILSNGQKRGTYSLTVVNCKIIKQWVVNNGDLHVVSCEFEKNSQNDDAVLYCTSGGRIFAENCDLTVDGRYYIGISGPARGTYILRNCKIDRYSIHSSSTIAFAGSNSLKGTGTGDAATPTQTVLIERGAVVNISGNTNADTATIISAGSGIKVVSNASATSPSVGGSAIIRSHRKAGYMGSWPDGNPEPFGLREDAGVNRYVSGTGTYIKGDGATDMPVISAAIVNIQCNDDSEPCSYVFNSPISATGKVTIDDSYIVFGSSMPADAIVGHPVELFGSSGGGGVTFVNKEHVGSYDSGSFSLQSNHKILATSVTSTCQIMGATVYASAGGDAIAAQWTSGGVTSTATINAGTSKVINGALISTWTD